MSTRSGKRIHNSFYETPVKKEEEVVFKSEVKTRSKKLRDNDQENLTISKSKKPKNYVSYPVEDNVTNVDLAAETAVETRRRKIGRYTLKENNNIESVTDNDVFDDSKKSTRNMRSTRKVSENEELSQGNNTEVVSGDLTKKKKKKKINVSVEEETAIMSEMLIPLKKKSKKKKKGAKSKKNSSEKNQSMSKTKMNKSNNTSGESFHSAAGSPILSSPHEKDTADKKSENNISISNNSKKLDSTIEKENGVENDQTAIAIGNSNSKRYSVLLTASFNQMDVDKASCNDLDSVLNMGDEKFSDLPKLDFQEDKIEKDSPSGCETRAKRRSNLMRTSFIQMDIVETINNIESAKLCNTTFDDDTTCKPNKKLKAKRKSSLLKSSFNASIQNSSDIQNTSFDKVSGTENSVSPTEKLNTTFDKLPSVTKTASLNATYDKETTPNLDGTFDKSNTKSNSVKSSLISSHNSSNVTLDKANDNSRISITSDDSKTENIVNTTPLLIESSLGESHISDTSDKTTPSIDLKVPEDTTLADLDVTPEAKENRKEDILPQVTPLKREGTFTKDGPDVIIMTPKPKTSAEKTPTKQMSLPSPGCTPFHGNRSSSQQKSILNMTRSIEKPTRRSSLADLLPPRQTKVMFCSPVAASTLDTQQKKKIIKSSLKGSNKSFVVDEDVTSSSSVSAARRKRSLTQGDAEEVRAKRTRLGTDMLRSAERLPRTRTASATAKLMTQITPKPVTPSKTKFETKVSRTKLPNFAALHRKQFDRMESLDECQDRKAKRARQLLTPNGNIAVLERSSPRVTMEPQKPKETKMDMKKPEVTKPSEIIKPETETTKLTLPTLESLRPGFTRFGFKMNIGVNPFISPIKSVAKAKENKPNGLIRQGLFPSLAGAKSSRKESAKHAVLREKSFSHSGKRDETRKENRTIIKGVRTNRRFELQMQMRNVK